jgi:hypothetical protein
VNGSLLGADGDELHAPTNKAAKATAPNRLSRFIVDQIVARLAGA